MSKKPYTKASSALRANPSTVRAVNWYLERKRSTLENRRDARFVDRMERRLARAVRKRFLKQIEYILEATKSFTIFDENNKGVRMMRTKDLENNFKRLMDEMPERESLVDDIQNHAEVTILRGGRTSARRVNQSLARLKSIRGETKAISVSFDLSNPETLRYLGALRVLHLSQNKGSIDRTTRSGVIKVLQDSVAEGVAYNEMANRITKLGDEGVFSKARAQMIAVNQMAKAYEHGNSLPPMEGARLTGEEVFKQWDTVGDDQVTPRCAANEAEGWLPQLEEFSSGDAHAPRGSHPRCRCATDYEFESVLRAQNIIG